MDKIHTCRVCGYYSADFEPWGSEGKYPIYVFCPSCGVESGYGDFSLGSVQNWRKNWLENSTPWADPSKKPTNWNLEEQLSHIPPEFQ